MRNRWQVLTEGTDAELSTHGNRSNDAEPHRGINRHNAEENRGQVLAEGMQTWPKPGCVATRQTSLEEHEERKQQIYFDPHEDQGIPCFSLTRRPHASLCSSKEGRPPPIVSTLHASRPPPTGNFPHKGAHQRVRGRNRLLGATTFIPETSARCDIHVTAARPLLRRRLSDVITSQTYSAVKSYPP